MCRGSDNEAVIATSNILIVGCGDIGIELGKMLADSDTSVWGLRRKPLALPDGIKPLCADVTQPETLTQLSALAIDYVVITLTPARFDDESYRQVFVDGLANLLTVLTVSPSLKHVVFVSSTSVYQQDDGQWVDETSATLPSSFSGQRLLQAEQLLIKSGLSSSIVRFAGIYGPGRRRLIEQVIAKQGCAKAPELYTNRIHRDDCVGFLAHLISCHRQNMPVESLYIGVDSEPVSMWELKGWLAEQLAIDTASMTITAPPRRNSKRCSNKRLLASGYKLLYPGYRQGYGELLQNEQ